MLINIPVMRGASEKTEEAEKTTGFVLCSKLEISKSGKCWKGQISAWFRGV